MTSDELEIFAKYIEFLAEIQEKYGKKEDVL